MMEVKFIKFFEDENEALKFAEIHNAEVIVHYDWDGMLSRIVRQYEVKY